MSFFAGLALDFRFTWRTLTRSKTFAVAAILTLALGIGVNSAMFSILDALLIRPLPYPQADRLFDLGVALPNTGRGGSGFSYLRALEMRAAARQIEIAAYTSDAMTLTGDGNPEPVTVARVTANYLQVVGIVPAAGRAFAPVEEKSDTAVMISHRFWTRRFQKAPRAVGQSLALDGRAYTIVGVTPSDFDLPFAETDIYLPRIDQYPRLTREQIEMGAGYMRGLARLRPGVTLAQAQAELDALNLRYLQAHPAFTDAAKQGRISMIPIREFQVGDLRTTLYTLGGAVCFVLLIACANVANLLLTRAVGRRKELAVRAALGADTWQITRQTLMENLILYATGAALGLLLASLLIEALPHWPALTLPRVSHVRIDGVVLGYTAGLTLLMGLAFGLLPAWRIRNANRAGQGMRESARGSSRGVETQRLQKSLVAAQVALSLVLLLAAGQLIRSLSAAQSVAPGFDPSGVWSFRVNLPAARYASPESRVSFVEQFEQRLRVLPGVTSASVAIMRPLDAGLFAFLAVEGRPPMAPGERPVALWQTVSDDYTRTLAIPLRRGRWFDSRDAASSTRVTVISETMARQFFPNQDPIGQRVQIGRQPSPSEIIGIVADVRNRGLEETPVPAVYSLYRQWPRSEFYVFARSEGDPAAIANLARRELGALDRDLPMVADSTLDSYVSDSLGRRKLTLWLLGGFALAALLLAVAGIHGVVSYTVAQRTQEMAIRRALGATGGQVFSLVVRQSAQLTAIGIAVGIAVSLVINKNMIAGMLFRVPAIDPLTYAVIPLVFLAVGILAAAWPAWRASRVDPAASMRAE